jgi:hypothetical protein
MAMFFLAVGVLEFLLQVTIVAWISSMSSKEFLGVTTVRQQRTV